MRFSFFRTSCSRGGVTWFAAGGGQCRLTVRGTNPKIQGDDWSGYSLIFSHREKRHEISLDACNFAALKALCRQAGFLENHTSSDPHSDASLREQARLLCQLNGSQTQRLLREVQSESLLRFLWFIKDERLIRQMLDNMSEHAAEMLLDDLISQFGGIDPERAPERMACSGREAAVGILELHRSQQAQCPADDGRGELHGFSN